MLKTEPLKTRRNQAHYGDRVVIDGIPMASFKAGKKKDLMTAEEIVEDIYKRPVERIVFRDMSCAVE